MTIKEVARLQGCSERQARRYCVAGLHGKVLRSTMHGNTRLITAEDYKVWRADCGLPPLPEPEPEKAPLAAPTSDDPPAADPVVLPEEPMQAPDPDDLEGWSSDELEDARHLWMRPDCPNGPPTNQPAFGSGSMPNPENFALLVRANAILQERYLLAQPRTAPRPASRFQLRQTY